MFLIILMARSPQIGGLAQLVERVLSMHEVVSSILTFSKLLLLILLALAGKVGEPALLSFACHVLRAR